MKLVLLSSIPEEGVSHNPDIVKQVMLHPGDLPHVMNFSRARLQPGQTARGHEHADMYETFYVEAGTGTITIDGKPFALGCGSCVLVEPGEVHEITNAGIDELVLLYFGVQR